MAADVKFRAKNGPPGIGRAGLTDLWVGQDLGASEEEKLRVERASLRTRNYSKRTTQKQLALSLLAELD